MTISEIRALWARPWVKGTITTAFLLLVAALIVRQARTFEWSQVITSVKAYRAGPLAIALLLSAASYAVYSGFDLIGRHYTHAKVGKGAAMCTAFVSYAFNQSLGALIGAVAFRMRLYSRLGLKTTTISKLITLSIVTNWLGYATVAGIVFMLGSVELPAKWDVGSDALRFLGGAMLTTALAYIGFCAFSERREFRFRGTRISLPTFKLALAQLALSIVRWPLEAATVYVLLGDRVEFLTVLGALSLNAIAGVMLHIPAGLGVLEWIFMGLLSQRMPSTDVLAAVLVFRAVYYVVPLAVASLIYIGTEAGSVAPAAQDG